jgi:hypothetical protein
MMFPRFLISLTRSAFALLRSAFGFESGRSRWPEPWTADSFSQS